MLRSTLVSALLACAAGFSSQSSIHSSRILISSLSASFSSDPWIELEQVAENHQKEKGRILFHPKELEESLATALEKELEVDFRVATTWPEATRIFWTQRQAQVIGGAVVVSLLLRFASFSLSFGVSDLAALVLTPLAWELQEWAYHYRNFHGNNGKSHFPFEYHNRHHDLPYYHVSMEPASVCLGWVLSISVVAMVSCTLFGSAASTTIATAHVAYLLASLRYLWVHFLAHSKVPLTGELQAARAHHIQHHLDREVNFNMASQTMDGWIGTVPTAKKRRAST